jgi:hypothetical protein
MTQPEDGSEDLRSIASRLGIRLPGESQADDAVAAPASRSKARDAGSTHGPPRTPADTPQGVWQSRLSSHFERLAEARSEGQAVFALEHGLSDEELGVISGFVRTETRAIPRSRHWLLWAVYAAELGYHYNGEYWQTFLAETPGWDDSDASRKWIRHVFRWFGDEYRGPRPTGTWASTFTIIAWPITNALLPKDLQRHVARALYEVQAGLARHLEHADDLGRYIADNCWVGSDRFQQLTEQPLLLGQIALALLRPSLVGEETILRGTLERVAADLRQERQAAAWLNSARRTVEESVVRKRGRAFLADSVDTPSERIVSAARACSPDLILVPNDGDSSWSVRLRLPHLAPLLDVSPDIRAQVAGSRASVPAAPNSRLATGQLLFPDQEIELERWPRVGEPLLKFEGISEGLETALLTYWAMTPGPWLFSIRRNRSASAILSRRVRSGRSYLVALSESSETSGTPSGLPLVDMQCDGVTLIRLDVPDHIESDLVEALKGIGVVPTREVTMWPAGVLPAEWDGDERIRWLSGDPALVGVRTDHRIENFSVTLDDAVLVRVDEIVDSEPRYVLLPRLVVGEHVISVSYEALRKITTSTLRVEVREPRPTVVDGSGPLLAWVEPYSHNLESLWEGRSVVRVEGAASLSASCIFTLISPTSPAEKVVRGIALPLSGEDWRRLLRDSIQRDDAIQRSYLEARAAQVTIDAGPIGRCSAEFDRELPPVRWLLHEGKSAFQLELRDDTEGTLERELRCATFEAPDQLSSLDSEDQIEPNARGGLYVAQVGGRTAAIVVPPVRRSLDSFSDLSVRPTLTRRARSTQALQDLITTTQLWSSARLPGDIRAQVWRTLIVRLLNANLFGLICGGTWRSAERTLERDRSDVAYRALEFNVCKNASDRLTVAGALVAAGARFIESALDERVEQFAALTRRAAEVKPGLWRPLAEKFGDSADLWFAEFCLRAASDTQLQVWAGDSLPDALSLLMDWPLLARTARCLTMASLVLAVDIDFPPLFPSWEWRTT